MAKKPAAPEAPQQDPTNLLREIDETLHYDRLQELWATYKWWVIGGVIAIFAAVLSVEGAKQFQSYQSRSQATEFFAAWTAADTEALSKISRNSSTGFELLALLEAAKLSDNPQEVLADAPSMPRQWQDLLTYYQGQAAFAAADYATAQEYFDTLDNGNSWLRPLALEALGMIAAQTGNKADADAYFDRAADQPAVPPSLQRRLQARQAQLNK